ncbi:MAG: DNA polymerase IV [Termitinemataceae bacterium]|nr:MAG: DNA polymerase IV [Termitinemataceae bacterium]
MRIMAHNSIHTFIHADLDAFYASVEQFDNPQYRGKPVIIGGLLSDKRSVVSTASYEARKFGVHAAMPTAIAYQLCPFGIFIRGNMARYKEVSNIVMSIFYDFTPDVQQMSIDEAFLDITGTERLFGHPCQLASKLMENVFNKTGLTISIGIASNKYVAKIASGIKKPNGLTVIEPGDEEHFMLSLPIKKIWGIGRKTQGNLTKYNLHTCADIHKIEKITLINMFGNHFGTFLYSAVRGLAATEFCEEPESHSISNEHTFESDVSDQFAIENAMLNISYKLIFRLLELHQQSKTVFVKIRYGDFKTESVQTTLMYTVKSVSDLFETVKKLFYSKYQNGQGIRLLGAGFSNVKESTLEQAELFDEGRTKRIELEKCIHEINKKYPKSPVTKARLSIVNK